jgi:hypothetical protein
MEGEEGNRSDFCKFYDPWGCGEWEMDESEVECRCRCRDHECDRDVRVVVLGDGKRTSPPLFPRNGFLLSWRRLKSLSSNLLIIYLVILNLINNQSVKCAPVQRRSTPSSNSMVSHTLNICMLLLYHKLSSVYQIQK